MSLSSPVLVSSAPGKLILAGEHAVVHGTRALATVIDKRTFAAFYTTHNKQQVQLQLLDLGKTYTWTLQDIRHISKTHSYSSSSSSSTSSLPNRETLDAARTALTSINLVSDDNSPSSLLSGSCLVFLLYFTFHYCARSSVVCCIRSDLPMSAGLGSSASFCAALATGFYALVGRRSPSASLSSADLQVINAWAYEGERILHGNPSGVDNTCVVYGGVIVYQKQKPIIFLPHLPPIELLITNTKQPRDTKKLVAGVGELLQRHPSIITPILTAIDNIVNEWVIVINQSAVSSSSSSPSSLLSSVSSLVRLNQCLLSALNVSHPTVDRVVDICSQAGMVSKLTGAGGGGCVIAFPSSSSSHSTTATSLRDVEQRLQSAGFECLHGLVGQDGVRIEQNTKLWEAKAEKKKDDEMQRHSLSNNHHQQPQAKQKQKQQQEQARSSL